MVKRFQKFQIEALEQAFQGSDYLTTDKKIELSGTTGLDMEQIVNWFNRNRVRKRKRESVKELEQVNSKLKQSLQEALDREAKLHKELQECIWRTDELVEENKRIKRRLTSEGDSFYDYITRFINGNL